MPIKHHKATIQIGGTTLDADIEIDEAMVIDDDQLASMKGAFANYREYIAKYPTWVKEADKVVDGSIVQPVTDPARLLETKEGK